MELKINGTLYLSKIAKGLSYLRLALNSLGQADQLKHLKPSGRLLNLLSQKTNWSTIVLMGEFSPYG